MRCRKNTEHRKIQIPWLSSSTWREPQIHWANQTNHRIRFISWIKYLCPALSRRKVHIWLIIVCLWSISLIEIQLGHTYQSRFFFVFFQSKTLTTVVWFVCSLIIAIWLHSRDSNLFAYKSYIQTHNPYSLF